LYQEPILNAGGGRQTTGGCNPKTNGWLIACWQNDLTIQKWIF